MDVTEEELARFMGFVEKLPSGCWFWTGARSRGRGNRKWYGSFRFRGRVIRAHAFSSDILAGRGPLPRGFHRDHICRFSLCVNPEHLIVVSKELNQARRWGRGFCGMLGATQDDYIARGFAGD